MQSTCCWCHATLAQAGTGIWLCPTAACAQRQWAWAVVIQVRGGKTKALYVPTPRQTEFHESTAKHTLFGGAAGPGKSHALRWEFYKRCLAYPGYEALLLRRTFPELNKTHIRRAQTEQALIGAKLITGEEKVLRFPNGSLLEFGHCDSSDAVSRYLSSEFDAIGFDEWSTFEPEMSLEIMTRARSSKPGIRAIVKGGSNPGGVGSLFLLDCFIDKSPDPERFKRYNAHEWAFVPALLDDNPYRDAEYEDQLAILSDERYQQLRFGDWRVFAGQFFTAWRESRDGEPWHVRDVSVDKSTEWFASMDWGYVAPGCVLWWACLPDGHYHIGHEWKFSSRTPEEVAREVLAQTRTLGIKKLRYLVADPSMWQKGTGAKGESRAETMRRHGLNMRPGDNDRGNGWPRCQSLLREAPDHQPWLTVGPTCAYLRRTIPAAVSDKTDPEDVDTHIDDHGLDAWRYGAMSRPAPTRLVVAQRPKGSAGQMLDDLRKELAVA